MLHHVHMRVQDAQFFLFDENMKQVYQWFKHAGQTVLQLDVDWRLVQACLKRGLDLLVVVVEFFSGCHI